MKRVPGIPPWWGIAALGGILALGLSGCPIAEGPGPTTALPPPIVVPEPSDTDLRDFQGDARDRFLEALEDLRRGRIQRAQKLLGGLRADVDDSPALRAAAALADLVGGAVAGPLEQLRRESGRAEHSRFVILCYAAAAEAADEPAEAYRAVETVLALHARTSRGADDPQAGALRERAARLRAHVAEARLEEGRRLLEEGSHGAALAALREAAEADENVPGLLAQLGRAELLGGQAVEAVGTLQRARASAPDDGDVGRDLASAYLASGRPEDARELFGVLLAADPADSVAKAGLEEARAEIRRLSLPARFRDLEHQAWVSRGELAALLFESVAALRTARQTVRGVVVTDLAGSWARDYVLMAVSRGLMEAYGDHTFGPDERVTRADLAHALARAVEAMEASPGALLPESGRPPGAIEDLPRGHGRFGSIVSVLNYGLMDLSEDRSFRPAAAATGREAVDAVRRLGELLVQER